VLIEPIMSAPEGTVFPAMASAPVTHIVYYYCITV